jgi:hypothetical protein
VRTRDAALFLALSGVGCAGSAATSPGVDAAGGAPVDTGAVDMLAGGEPEAAGGSDASEARETGGTSDTGGAVDAMVSSDTSGGMEAGMDSAAEARPEAGGAGLMFLKAPSMMTNKQAALYCDQLSQDGFSDWRVAAPEELATWPGLAVDSNAYVTGPIYIPVTAPTVQDGCTGNSHSCNLTQYNAGSLACAWQGVGFVGPTVCVRGTAPAGSLATKYAATTCDSCRSHVTGATADFKIADCLPYAK